MRFGWPRFGRRSAGAGQEPAPKAGEQSPPVKEITGTVTSVDDSCGSFVLQTKTEAGKLETKFDRNADLGPWFRELQGCSMVFGTGEKMLLKPGIRVTVRYSVQDTKNVVSSVGAPRNLPEGTFPVCTYCPNPPYDSKAKKKRVQGSVLLNLVVLPDGTVSEVKVVRSLDKGLDESAVETARKWRFRPVMGPAGKPVSVEFSVEVTFRLLN